MNKTAQTQQTAEPPIVNKAQKKSNKRKSTSQKASADKKAKDEDTTKQPKKNSVNPRSR